MAAKTLLVFGLAIAFVLIPSYAFGCVGVDCSISGDDTADSIRGDLLIPAATFRGEPGVRKAASNCPGCIWELLPDCRDAIDSICLGSVATCPPRQNRFEIRLLRPTDTLFNRVGSVCLGPGTPRTPAELSALLVDDFEELLPRQTISFQPASGGLVNVATLFASGQPAEFGPADVSLGPFDVTVTAAAQFTWVFDGDDVLQTAEPGGAWPDDSVSHTFTRAGARPVQLTTQWLGEFTVDGFGPYPVAGGPVSQSSSVTVPVREARARLISGLG
jgi:hypothetical protein